MATAVWLCMSGVLVAATACTQRVRCEEGLCPAGTACNPDNGQCEPDQTLAGPAETGVFGPFSAVALSGLQQGFLARSSDQQSLVWLQRENKHTTSIFVAGPAAGGDTGPAGEASAAVAGTDGRVHIALTRGAKADLWYATRGSGSWQLERIGAVPQGKASNSLAIAAWLERPAIVYRTQPEHGLAMVWKQDDGTWTHETIPPPPGGAADLGAIIALSAWKDSLSVATYDAVGGDLVVAVRKAGVWNTGRLAGAASPGGGQGDAGLPVDLARTSAGELIIAYRDRGRNQVRLLRSEGGKTVDRLVSDGSYLLPGGAQTRRVLLGTALSVAVLLDGRIAVACQDGSRMRIQVMVEKPGGDFVTIDVPDQGRPQAWPRLLVQVDGTLLVAWVDIDPESSPPDGRLLTWALPVAAVQP